MVDLLGRLPRDAALKVLCLKKQDEIEKLRTENAELRAALSGGEAHADWQNHCNESWNKLVAERDELARKLAVAVEALEHYADPDLLCYQEEDIDENGFEGIMYYFRGVYPKASAFKGEGPWNFAQEALAKIKQDKPECEHEYELRQIFMEGRAVDSDYFCLKCGAPKP